MTAEARLFAGGVVLILVLLLAGGALESPSSARFEPAQYECTFISDAGQQVREIHLGACPEQNEEGARRFSSAQITAGVASQGP